VAQIGVVPGHRPLEDQGRGPAASATLPDRGRPRAPRCPGAPAAGSGDAGAGPLPADLGRDPPRPRAAQPGSCPRSIGRWCSTPRCRRRTRRS
jgi:hypothetical protein